MTDRSMGSDYESRIAKLLADNPTLKLWLEQMRAFAKDGKGQTVIIGLDVAETEEFLELDPTARAHMFDELPRTPENLAAVDRYHALRDKHDAARAKDAVQNLAFYQGGVSKQ